MKQDILLLFNSNKGIVRLMDYILIDSNAPKLGYTSNELFGDGITYLVNIRDVDESEFQVLPEWIKGECIRLRAE